MLRNFLKIAYRNLFKYKYYTIINILGFAIGLSVFAITYLYAFGELSFDDYHEKSDRIYRLARVYEKDSTLNKYATTPFPLSKVLLKEFPNYIKDAVRVFNFENDFHLVEYHDKHFNEKSFYYADPSILNVLDFNFNEGSEKNALTSANTVIISESIKKKYFGKFSPLGKEIIIDEGFPMTVTGVYQDFPEQSHFRPEIITSLSSLYVIYPEPDTWLWSPCWTYILLHKGTDPKKLEKKLPDFIRKHFDIAIRDYSSIFLQPITDIHLKSQLEGEIGNTSKSLYVYILLWIAGFLLFVSWLNFINLSIVGSITRIREISIRKILGSSKRLVSYQFIVEALLASMVSLLLSLFLIEAFVPLVNYFTGEKIQVKGLIENGGFFIILGVAIVAGTIVGLYTGGYASSFPTFNVGRFKYKLASKKWFTGKILILVQYSISLLLLIVVFVNFKQLIYLKTAELGFDEKNVLIIPVISTPVAENYEEFKSILLKSPDIESITAVNRVVGSEQSYRRYFYERNGIKKVQFFPEIIVRHDFIETMKIKLLVGTNFKKGTTEDVGTAKDEVIINERLARDLGYDNYRDALGEKLISFKGNERIIGVIKDFNSRSLHQPVSPLAIRMAIDNYNATLETNYLLIKFKNRITKQTYKFIHKLWQSYSSNRPLESYLLDKLLDKQYKNEDLLNFFLWVFSILIIVISSMGVWAVTSLLSIQRTKEIGIRKAIGASVQDILKLFIKDFFNLLLIAHLTAWPLSWLLIKEWFKNFAHHTNIEWQVYVYASFSILILTLGIVTRHALKVAQSNTIDSLRDE